MDDYDDYDEPVPRPTFSEGSHGRRGDNIKANASRIHASKSAISAASRASAISAASIQQLSKNTVITSSGIRQQASSSYTVNKSQIQAAQMRANKVIQSVQAVQVQSVQTKTPIINHTPQPINSVETAQVIKHRPVIEPRVEVSQVYIEPVNKYSELYDTIVKEARSKKEELLAFYTEPYRSIYLHRSVQYRKLTLDIEEYPIDKNALDKLCINIKKHLETSNSIQVLDEFKRYEDSLRISQETLLHKSAIEKALQIKNMYFASDT
jgi:hypothetical protein